jgi:ferritin-like metal-binding protein YciE
MQLQSINDLTLHFLKDIYYAERQILKALPKMAKAAQSEQLKQAFTHHREQTQGQVDRLGKVFELMGKRAQGTTCEAIIGLIEEGEELVEQSDAGPVRDAGLIACAQAVEHYEIARYGALIAWVKAAGMNDAVKLLEETLAEEKQTDAQLNELATSEVNKQAQGQGKTKAA